MTAAVAHPFPRVLLLVLALGLLGSTCHESRGQQTFASPETEPIALSPDGSLLFFVDTTANRVLAIDLQTLAPAAPAAQVGMEPVSVEVRPDGQELWVANHLSDSISILASDPADPDFFSVIGTVQDLDGDLVTNFDEPADIVFASNAKAYVSLSSTDRIAIVDVASRTVTGHIDIPAQDPRAIAVRNNLLYVAAFESNNQTQISYCNIANGTGVIGDPCSLGNSELVTFVTNPNIPGAVKNIVTNPSLPDRDVFVYDTSNDQLVDTVEGVGTLLYGLAVDSSGRAFVTHTDARNVVNGDHLSSLADLDNRVFLNRIASIPCSSGGCGGASIFDLEPAPPAVVPNGSQLATPHAIRISADDSVLVATAAGTSRVFTVDAGTGAVLDILDLGSGPGFGTQIPRGLALVSDAQGAPLTAYVLNSLDRSLSIVDVSNPSALALVSTSSFRSGRAIPEEVRRGRVAFMNAFASSSGTFSCESCHPDGNTDQLLWRIGGACSFGACSGEDEPRTTMPIRGLANTLPLHWDGSLGDPLGGPNGATGSGGSLAPSCTDEASCFRHLVDGSLAGVMCDQAGGCPGGGELSSTERDDMAAFLASVPYPPARLRRMEDTVSTSARDGFADFFLEQGGVGPSTCADSDAGCHELPLGASTNSATLQAFDAPTMRGLNDRFLQFSMGLSMSEDSLVQANAGGNLPPFGSFPPLESPIQWDPAVGFREVTTFGAAFSVFDPVYNVRPIDIFQMVEEASTGFSGAVGRQVRLDTASTGGAQLAATQALLAALESADAAGTVNFQGFGTFQGEPVRWSFVDGVYRGGDFEFDRTTLIGHAQSGDLALTLTGWLRNRVGTSGSPQPLLATLSTGNGATGDPPLPLIGSPSNPVPFSVRGTDVDSSATMFVDGALVGGSLSCVAGTSGDFCDDGAVSIDLDARPATGLRLLQVQNPGGLLSNELPICVGNANDCD